MEKPFVISLLAFLIEIASFLIGIRLARRRRANTEGDGATTRLLIVTVLSAVLTMLFPILFVISSHVAIWTIHPMVTAILFAAVALPFIQFIHERRVA